MKLSKQERIAAVVVLVLVILVAGVFLFIKPNIETIISTKATLADKEKEYNDAVARAGTKDSLKTQILDAYDQGKNLADMFFPELAAYELDYEFHEFLNSLEANVLVEDFTVSAPATASLSTYVYVPSEVGYALKDYVNQGGSTEIDDPRLIRQAMIQGALGEAQTIGASAVSFTVVATSNEDLLKFADEVNDYVKAENGKNIRKAIELNGISISYPNVQNRYDDLSKELLENAEAAAPGAFSQMTGITLPGSNNSNTGGATATPSEGNDGNTADGNGNTNTDEEANIGDYYYTLNCTITFYSIERMQDPTSTLNEQDAAI